MSHDKTRFSHIMCNAATVREAFPAPKTTKNWWHCILLLHGKPVDINCSPAERIACIADGFKFYAHLYRFLSILFFFLAPILYFSYRGTDPDTALYAALADFAAGTYLWSITSLGYAGAQAYRQQKRGARTSLLAFMVMIVAFLSAFVAAISIVAQQREILTVWTNILSCSALFILGIGSYFIEIVYLATEASTIPTMAKVATTSAKG